MEQFSQVANAPRIITCVYCGQAYPQDTPTWGDKVLTDHIKICEKHPMRKAEADIRKLRKVLYKVLGDKTKSDLEFRKKSFEMGVDRCSTWSIEDQNESEYFTTLKNHLEAINVMLETMEYEK